MWKLTRELRHLVAEVDSSVNFNPVKRRKREKSQVPTAHFAPIGDGTAALGLTADTATIAGVDAFVSTTARAHKLGVAETIIQLLTGQLAPETHATIQVYSVGGQAFIPRYGWLGDSVDALFNHSERTIIDLHAACHALCDKYEADGNYEACVEATASLEREFGLKFEFTSDPEEPPYPNTHTA